VVIIIHFSARFHMDRVSFFLHIMTMARTTPLPLQPASSEAKSSTFRYLPTDARDWVWGLHIRDAGYIHVPPGVPYPVGAHPAGYMFEWERGRILAEYQVLYITRGNGFFESTHAGLQRLHAGSLIILFPGEWHRYRPDPKTGWDETWIGFDGDFAKRLMDNLFQDKKPIFNLGINEALLQGFHAVWDVAHTSPVGSSPLLSAKTIDILARIHLLESEQDPQEQRIRKKLHEACAYLLAHSSDAVNLPALAREVGISYTHFRRIFLQHTGLSPRQYHIQIRINRAKDLLASSDLSVSEIAERLGFSSVFYFSRLFHQKTGQSPLAYRANRSRTA
jgi:AraC-like DNA-binding protein